MAEEVIGDLNVSTNAHASDYIYFHKAVTTNGGALQHFDVYIGSTAPTKLICAIYTHDAGNDEPDDLIANTTSAEEGSANTTAWNELAVTSGATLTATTTYWIALLGDHSGNYDGPHRADGGDRYFLSRDYDSGFPANAGAVGGSGTNTAGFTATLEYAVSGTSPQIIIIG